MLSDFIMPCHKLYTQVYISIQIIKSMSLNSVSDIITQCYSSLPWAPLLSCLLLFPEENDFLNFVLQSSFWKIWSHTLLLINNLFHNLSSVGYMTFYHIPYSFLRIVSISISYWHFYLKYIAFHWWMKLQHEECTLQITHESLCWCGWSYFIHSNSFWLRLLWKFYSYLLANTYMVLCKVACLGVGKLKVSG